MTPNQRHTLLEHLYRIMPLATPILKRGGSAPRCAVCGLMRRGHPTCAMCAMAVGPGHLAGERLTGVLCERCAHERQRRMRR